MSKMGISIAQLQMLSVLARLFVHLKIILALATCWTLAMSTSVEAQNLLWARRAGSGGAPSIPQDVGQAIAVDGLGNSYVTGQFRNTATFGQGQPNQTVLTATGSAQEIFIAKYDSNGFLQWAKRISTAQGEGNGIGVDALANIYVTGYFNSSATFAPLEGNQTTITSAGGLDIFLAKYDTNGNFIWAKRAGSTFFDQAEAIAVDALGNSYVTGRFGDVARFGAGEANQTDLTAPGSAEDIFAAKYNSNGLLQWAKRAGGTGTDRGFGIAIDGAGNSYVTGIFNGSAMFPATFGPGEANQANLVAANFNDDLFIAKYNDSGLLQWAERAGGLEADRGAAIAVDSAGRSYVTGNILGRAFFAPGEANETFIDASVPGEEEIFVAKYDSGGALLSVFAVGQGFGEGIAVDPFRNVYVTGHSFNGILVARFKADNSEQWRRDVGTGGTADRGFAIALDGVQSVLVTGQFDGTVIFGQGELTQTSLVSAGAADVFVAKYAAGPIFVDCPTDSLQTAINLAGPGQTIQVTGTCSENLLVRNEKQRITIDGGFTATISAPSNTSPAVNIRGKGILLQNFTITGGSNGVWVNRGSNAVLNTNVIQNSTGNGVLVDELAFAVLTNNTIQNHPAAGAFVSEHSTARIGFNADSDTVASPNVIVDNLIGVIIANGSSARIVGNTIQNQTGDAIQVLRDSHAEISSNQIFTNGGDGIEVGENSFVQLGEDSGTSIFESPNASTNANLGFAIRCTVGGMADGRLGTLNGIAGVKSFSDPSCIDSLN